MREQLIKLVEIVPIEVIIRNIATGSLTKRLGIADGTILEKPLLEFSYKNDELGDPLIAKEHILAFNWATSEELKIMERICGRFTHWDEQPDGSTQTNSLDVPKEIQKHRKTWKS